MILLTAGEMQVMRNKNKLIKKQVIISNQTKRKANVIFSPLFIHITKQTTKAVHLMKKVDTQTNYLQLVYKCNHGF